MPKDAPGAGVEWRERGKGQLKVNQHKDTHRCRLLFRAEGLHSLGVAVCVRR